MTKSELVVRWVLGLLCLALEVVIVSIIIAAVSRSTDSDELFFWHPVLMTIGVILFLSHGTSQPGVVVQCNTHPVLTKRVGRVERRRAGVHVVLGGVEGEAAGGARSAVGPVGVPVHGRIRHHRSEQA